MEKTRMCVHLHNTAHTAGRNAHGSPKLCIKSVIAECGVWVTNAYMYIYNMNMCMYTYSQQCPVTLTLAIDEWQASSMHSVPEQSLRVLTGQFKIQGISTKPGWYESIAGRRAFTAGSLDSYKYTKNLSHEAPNWCHLPVLCFMCLFIQPALPTGLTRVSRYCHTTG